MRPVIIVFLCLGMIACRKNIDDYFTSDEKKQPLVLKELARDNAHSSHYVLMNAAEKPHYHDRHTVKTCLISGNGRLHLDDKIIDLKPNETVTIPAGTLHWAENLGPGYSLLSADFFPPFDGKDRRFTQ